MVKLFVFQFHNVIRRKKRMLRMLAVFFNLPKTNNVKISKETESSAARHCVSNITISKSSETAF